MGLEAASYIKDLVPANPTGGDPKGEGDNHIRMIKQVLQNNFAPYCGPNVPTATGSATAQAITYTSAPATYVPGMQIAFTPGFVNTGPCTINVNGLGPKPLWLEGSPLGGGELQPSVITEAILDSTLTAFHIISGRPGAAVANNSGRNLLDNSMIRIQQRGVGGFTATGGGVVGPDRWTGYLTGDTFTFQVAGIGDPARLQVGDEEFSQMLQCNVTGTSGASNCSFLSQSVENVRRMAGKTFTLSWWGNTSTAGAKVGISTDQVFGTGGSPSAVVQNNSVGVITLPDTTWRRYKLTFSVPDVQGKTLGTNVDDFTRLIFWLSSGGAGTSGRAGGIGVQSWNAYFWGFQLEEGSVMTKLEKIDINTDALRCGRHYQTNLIVNLAGKAVAGGDQWGSTAGLVPVMRKSPTVALFSSASSININASPPVGALSNSAVWCTGQVTAAGAFTLIANLTASAELK